MIPEWIIDEIEQWKRFQFHYSFAYEVDIIEKSRLEVGKLYLGIAMFEIDTYFHSCPYTSEGIWNGRCFKTLESGRECGYLEKVDRELWKSMTSLKKFRELSGFDSIFLPIIVRKRRNLPCLDFFIKKNDDMIKIGNYSHDWEFLFNTNFNYYEMNRKSINRFLKLNKNCFYVRQQSGLKTINKSQPEIASIDFFWECVNESNGKTTLHKYYDYPSCLNFYDNLGERIPNSNWLRNILPVNDCVLKQLLRGESFSDKLTFYTEVI